VVLVCPHGLFVACARIASQLKDRSSFHTNIVQAVILVDSETREVLGDYSRPVQYRREVKTVLSAARRSVE